MYIYLGIARVRSFCLLRFVLPFMVNKDYQSLNRISTFANTTPVILFYTVMIDGIFSGVAMGWTGWQGAPSAGDPSSRQNVFKIISRYSEN